ncbi:MAG: peptidase M14 [Acetobacteraceae bacterium SCN 69-10]|nr:succinylglutamate desuccinylase/aspartoacylase family protein [Rhodospirillales bacterium]ODU61885.1 MAG: peptidase M14 [Acetobacteraceae bacterium SCN 69-10]OJY70242.1 MAG: peptidase M14 [Rhodospirillales bacterium 70-18]
MTEPADTPLAAQPPLPRFAVEVTPPDIAPWLAGNIGIPGFTSHAAPEPGPHVAVIGLTHGNELAGGVVLDHLLRSGLRPSRGRLTLGFANLAAFARFDPAHPTASRFLDEDLNRLWDTATLDGPRQSSELARARQIRPLIDTVDVLLDLHSMLWPSDPLILSGNTAKGRALALAIGTPPLVVADAGHVSGKRMIDYGRFADPAAAQVANLVEAGQHWQPDTVATTLASVAGLLRHLDMVAPHAALPPAPATPPARRYAQVTTAITASTASFAFVQSYRGGDVIARRNTLIALDGTAEIRTPHDDCLLVMPSLRPSRGHTAVRLAQLLPA